MEPLKKCTKCAEWKPRSLFAKRSRSSDGLSSWCKACFAAYDRNRYATGDKVRKAASDLARKERAKDWIWEYLLRHPCADCGEVDPIVLDFDHRDPAEKSRNIAEMMKGCGVRAIAAEVAKCDVRCANCHRRRTAEQFGFWRASRAA